MMEELAKQAKGSGLYLKPYKKGMGLLFKQYQKQCQKNYQ